MRFSDIFQTISKAPEKFQKDQTKIAGGVARKKGILPIHL